ncbi:alpha/beta hydrolase [Nonomuraea sp. NPDC026600]|uniref:alpha/beta hydrolase n=1 Tax=Nonomuraea sp. NPDC026600 TaxID=3155363 RepID=UPI0033D765C1
MIDASYPVTHVPARNVPVPKSLSEQAQALLAMGVSKPQSELPPVDDLEAWRALVAERNAMVTGAAVGIVGTSVTGAVETGVGTKTEDVDVDGVTVYAARPDGLSPDDRRVLLLLHGGAFIMGGGAACRSGAAAMAGSVGATVWSVDYRMPPNHPHPAPLDESLTVYRRLLKDHRPEEIAIGGISAGANLTAALILRARDEGLPLPAAAVLMTPPTDLTRGGDTLATNDGVDSQLVEALEPLILLYAGGHDLRDPYLSPLFGDFTKGFSPTILFSGTRDRLLSDTVRLHRKLRAAGIPADLHVFEAAPHGFFLGTAPEDHERVREIRRFLDEHWAKPVTDG